MDTPTHVLAGLVVGEAFFRGKLGRAAPIVAGVAALAPDMDMVIGWVSRSPFATLEYHRGFTHGLIFVPLLALAVAAVAKAVSRRSALGWLFLAALAGGLCQPLLDWTNSYGTQLLWPFSHERFALDWTFIVDPWLVIVLVGTLILSWRQLKRGKDSHPVAIRGAAMAGIYLLLLGGLHQAALDRLDAVLAEKRLEPGVVHQRACTPVPGTPFAWNAIYTTGDRSEGVRTSVGTIWVLGDEEPTFEMIISSPETPAVRAALDTPEGRTYTWFSRFPVVETKAGENGSTVVEVWDARFRTYAPQWLATVFGQGLTEGGRVERKPFRFHAVVAADGKVETVGMSH